MIPPGFQYPDDTFARLSLGQQIYSSPGFEETERRITAPIKLEGETDKGQIEVGYGHTSSEKGSRPFFN